MHAPVSVRRHTELSFKCTTQDCGRFIYTGNLADLSACRVGESVYYPNFPSTPYIWPLPMITQTVNPTVVFGSATTGYLEDTNSPPSSYQTPYSSTSFAATQRFWWNCTNYNNNSVQNLVPDITITRSIFKDTDGYWKYKIVKSGSTNTHPDIIRGKGRLEGRVMKIRVTDRTQSFARLSSLL